MSQLNNSQVQFPAVSWTAGTNVPNAGTTGSAMPLLTDATTGRLMVDALTASSADLSIIQGKQDTTNGILTPQAADVASIKSYASSIAGFAIPAYNYISLGSYSGTNPTVIVFKSGGSSGNTVATLTLSYDGSGNLTSILKS